jgi:Ca2+-binding RTX toxin-like protein
MGANTIIEIINAGEGASVLWNTGGYTSIGAEAKILGTIYSGGYLSAGADASITGPNGTNGGLITQGGYMTLAAGVHVGIASNASVPSPNIVTGTAVANSLVTLYSATATLGTVLADVDGNFSYTLTALNVATLGQEVTKTITAEVTDAGVTVESNIFTYNDQLAGSFSNDTLLGTEGIDIIKGGIGDDILEGGGGADHLFGGDGIDTFVFNQGDSTAAFLDNGGTETTISGFDVIADFLAANGTVSGDLLSLPGTAVIAGSVTNADGVDSTSYADTVGSHTISNTGIVSFFSDDAGAVAVILDSANKLAVAVDYLTNNDLGNAGATLAFKTTIAGTADTYVYSQHDTNSGDTGTNNYSLVKLSGIDAAGVTTDALALTPDYIVID